MSIKSVTITLFFFSMISSTATYSNVRTHPSYERVFAEEWQKTCQHDISCKWEGGACTYKSNSNMKSYCEKSTSDDARLAASVKLIYGDKRPLPTDAFNHH